MHAGSDCNGVRHGVSRDVWNMVWAVRRQFSAWYRDDLTAKDLDLLQDGLEREVGVVAERQTHHLPQ